MLQVSASQRYFFYSGATDMRKGFDTLCGVVRTEFKMSPLGGDVFIFLSKGRSKIKLLQWQGDGFAIYYKRLEKGTFELPKINADSPALISAQQLMLIMEGISLLSVKKRPRYKHEVVDKTSVNVGVSA